MPGCEICKCEKSSFSFCLGQVGTYPCHVAKMRVAEEFLHHNWPTSLACRGFRPTCTFLSRGGSSGSLSGTGTALVGRLPCPLVRCMCFACTYLPGPEGPLPWGRGALFAEEPLRHNLPAGLARRGVRPVCTFLSRCRSSGSSSVAGTVLVGCSPRLFVRGMCGAYALLQTRGVLAMGLGRAFLGFAAAVGRSAASGLAMFASAFISVSLRLCSLAACRALLTALRVSPTRMVDVMRDLCLGSEGAL